jgi:hypothetical protein
MLFDLSSPGEEIFGGALEAVPEGFFEVAAEDFGNAFDADEDFGVAVAIRGRRSEVRGRGRGRHR